MTMQNSHRVRDRLHDRQRKLLEAIRNHLSLSGGDNLHRRPNEHEFTDDDAVADLLTEMEIATLSNKLSQLRELLRARKRIDDKRYGFCIECGSTIPKARLAAHPTAERCIGCQRKLETTGGTSKLATL
jgi:DnaK suppressor protein